MTFVFSSKKENNFLCNKLLSITYCNSQSVCPQCASAVQESLGDNFVLVVAFAMSASSLPRQSGGTRLSRHRNRPRDRHKTWLSSNESKVSFFNCPKNKTIAMSAWLVCFSSPKPFAEGCSAVCSDPITSPFVCTLCCSMSLLMSHDLIRPNSWVNTDAQTHRQTDRHNLIWLLLLLPTRRRRSR